MSSTLGVGRSSPKFTRKPKFLARLSPGKRQASRRKQHVPFPARLRESARLAVTSLSPLAARLTPFLLLHHRLPMGNLCGKQSADNFAGPGRTLGSAPPPSSNAKAAVPARVANNTGISSPTPKSKPKVGGPGRTTGGGAADNDPRSAAAAAAEARAQKTAGTGDLGKKLEAQKKQTRNQTLQEAARESRQQREADAATEARNYN
ncbi:hypothetical protein CC78DRAFT_580249 [Lojkania enalia]|uniref:Uncharacterized protein n=1 Tax=Lojkania enalia TaxID=147567 RepID=A0A9P4KB74_9PLEO|nr:hypothetical protein CC78DRAFT_580249 [Didymosphaeria enalia]